MIYPKIHRKSLALLLICLIFTLAAVGVMFIVYFFNANNSLFVKPLLKKIYSEGSYHHHQKQQEQHQQPQQSHQQLQQQKHQSLLQKFDRDIVDVPYLFYGENDGKRISQYVKKDKKTLRNSFLQGSDEMSEENFSGSRNNNYYTNSDTIYIDDYDRLNEKIDSNNNGEDELLDINGIDYFETIIMDHNHKKNLHSGNDQSRATQTSLTARDKDLLIFTKSLYNRKNNNMGKIKDRKSKNGKNKNDSRNNEPDAFDNETTGSGSGDFIDDTEVDEEQSAHKLSRKRLRNNNNKRNNIRRQKSRTFRIENRNENLYSVSSEIVSNLLNESTLKPLNLLNESSLKSSSSSVTSTPLSQSTGPSSITTTSFLPVLPLMTSSIQPSLSQSSAELRNNRINKLDKKPSGSVSNKKWMPPSIVSSREVITTITNPSPLESQNDHQNGAWLETRARRIMGNVKKSEERSRQLLLCEEAGGGELCRMLFKGHLNE